MFGVDTQLGLARIGAFVGYQSSDYDVDVPGPFNQVGLYAGKFGENASEHADSARFSFHVWDEASGKPGGLEHRHRIHSHQLQFPT